MKLIDKLAWIEIKDQSILLTKSFGKDKYYIPGGKRENVESDERALVREIREELSVDLKLEADRRRGHGLSYPDNDKFSEEDKLSFDYLKRKGP